MKNYLRLLWIFVLVAAAAAQTATPKHQPSPAMPAGNDQEVAALTNDLQQMRSLVRQMEMNLALVQTTTTPLKHQFELQIEAWNVLLNGMERRLQRLRSNTDGVVAPATVPLQRDSSRGTP